MFSNESIFSCDCANPTEKIITGMLKTITIKLLRVKFLLFSKFIEAAIDPKQDKTKDPIKKLISNNIILL